MKKTVSLVEVIVGIILVACIYGGLLTAFLAVRKYINRANSRLVAVNLSRNVFERLYNQVREDLWNKNVEENWLYANGANWTKHVIDPITIDGKIYETSWQVKDASNIEPGYEYRQVKINLIYHSD